jgi:hypothetical protein
MKTEIELDPSEVLRAIKEAQESAKCMLPSAEYEVLPPERQLPSPTRDVSHAPVLEVDITAPSERDVADSLLWGHHEDIERND